MVVDLVLLPDLLAGAGNDHRRRLQGLGLGLDAPGEAVPFLQGVLLLSLVQKSGELHQPKGMSREEEGDPQDLGHLGPHEPGIGVVPMDQVRGLAPVPDVAQDLIGQERKVGPEGFLTQVPPGAEGQAYDAGAFRELLPSLGVALVHSPVPDLPGHQVHLLHLFPLRQGPGLVHHVGDLATGVGVHSQLHVPAPDKPVDAQGHDVQASPSPGWRCFIRHGSSPGERGEGTGVFHHSSSGHVGRRGPDRSRWLPGSGRRPRRTPLPCGE